MSLHQRAPRLVIAALLVIVSAQFAPAGAQVTPGLQETRERVDELTRSLLEAEAELDEVNSEIAVLEAEIAEATAEADDRSDMVSRTAVQAFIAGSLPQGPIGEPLEAIRERELREAVLGVDSDSLEEYRSVFEDLDVLQLELDDKLARATQLTESLESDKSAMIAELARLEELERARLAEIERQRREAEARAAKEKAEREAAEAAAAAAGPASADSGTRAASASSDSGSDDGGSSDAGAGDGGSSDSGSTETVAAPEPAAPSTNTVLQYCPVAGPHSFIDSWGFPRSGGRRHKGVDMMANIGVPVVAPVSGTVKHRSNGLGGRSFHLNGDDGNYYYGTHLSSYGQGGYVSAGTVIGYVGDDGNARGIPHLHFEVHPGGGSAQNPFPYVNAVC